MNEADRQHQLDRQAVADMVDVFMESLVLLIGRRAVGHNAPPIRALAETLAIEALNAHDHRTPLHQPKVALEDNRAIDGDERAPTSQFNPVKGQVRGDWNNRPPTPKGRKP